MEFDDCCDCDCDLDDDDDYIDDDDDVEEDDDCDLWCGLAADAASATGQECAESVAKAAGGRDSARGRLGEGQGAWRRMQRGASACHNRP